MQRPILSLLSITCDSSPQPTGQARAPILHALAGSRTPLRSRYSPFPTPEMQPGVALSGFADHYVSLGWYHPLFLVLGCAVAITLGARSLAGEIDRGTIL